jgi:hypothetical protein
VTPDRPVDAPEHRQSIALDQSDRPHVAYFGFSGGKSNLRYATLP